MADNLNAQCGKCGSREYDVRYQPEEMSPLGMIPENVWLTCDTCGHKWNVKPLDRLTEGESK